MLSEEPKTALWILVGLLLMLIHTQIHSCFGFVFQLAFCVQDVNCGDKKGQRGFGCNRRTGGETGGEQVDEWAGLCTLLLL